MTSQKKNLWRRSTTWQGVLWIRSTISINSRILSRPDLFQYHWNKVNGLRLDPSTVLLSSKCQHHLIIVLCISQSREYTEVGTFNQELQDTLRISASLFNKNMFFSQGLWMLLMYFWVLFLFFPPSYQFLIDFCVKCS